MTKTLNYVEFRYEDGRKQCLRDKAAQNWMDFTKERMTAAHYAKPIKNFKPTWIWDRYSAEEEILNRPGMPKKPDIPTIMDQSVVDAYDYF